MDGKKYFKHMVTKRAGIANQYQIKNFKSKTVMRDKGQHYILIKRSIHQEVIVIIKHICTETESQNI